MTYKYIQGHRNCCYYMHIGRIWLPYYAISIASTLSEILELLQGTWLSVTFWSPSLSSIKFNSQAMRAPRFMCKHIIVKTCYISQVMGIIQKGLKQQKLPSSTLDQGQLVFVPFDRPRHKLKLHPYLTQFRCIIAYFPKFKEVTSRDHTIFRE